jgi:KaiC/GvpD/RAD55 family RecA-like ATPase
LLEVDAVGGKLRVKMLVEGYRRRLFSVRVHCLEVEGGVLTYPMRPSNLAAQKLLFIE